MNQRLRNLSGQNRKRLSFLGKIEFRFVKQLTPMIAQFFSTHILTLLSLLWTSLAILSGLFIHSKLVFLMSLTGLITAQYLTDLFDGAVGRYKQTGLIRWGFYMDHLLDYLFAISLAAAYTLFFRISHINTVLLITLIMGNIAHELIVCALKNGALSVSGHYGIGPTEWRLFVIFLNLVMMIVNIPQPNRFIIWLLGPAYLGFGFTVVKTQQKLWSKDMRRKKKKQKEEKGRKSTAVD